MEVPLEASRAKLRELRDTPFKLSATGLAILTSESEAQEAEAQRGLVVAQEAKSGSSRPKKEINKRGPKMRICHLCGTPQLLHSFRMHYTRCAQAWEQDEARKPVALRREIPKAPQLPDGGQPNDQTPTALLDDFNRQAVTIWKEKALETCPNCLRSFHAKALRAHAKGCHPANDFLGASFVGVHRNATGHEGSRSYPTVRESLDKTSPRKYTNRVKVSSPGSIHLDADRIEARRSVPPRMLSLSSVLTAPGHQKPPAPTQSQSPKKKHAPHETYAGSSTDLHDEERPLMISSIKQQNTHRNPKHHTLKPKTPQQEEQHSIRRRKNARRLEARLSALEANHQQVKSTLDRIERLLLHQGKNTTLILSHDQGLRKSKTASHDHDKHRQNNLVYEHNRIFRGNIVLAWPEASAQVHENKPSSPRPAPKTKIKKNTLSPAQTLRRPKTFLASKSPSTNKKRPQSAAYDISSPLSPLSLTTSSDSSSSSSPPHGFNWAPVRKPRDRLLPAPSAKRKQKKSYVHEIFD